MCYMYVHFSTFLLSKMYYVFAENIQAIVQYIYAESVPGRLELGNGDYFDFPEDFLEELFGEGVFQVSKVNQAIHVT